MSKYRKGQVVDFMDVDRSGNKFSRSGPIENVLANNLYLIIDTSCWPSTVHEVPEEDITKLIKRGPKSWAAIILTIIAILFLFAPFISQVSDSRFFIVSCVAAALCVFGSMLLLLRGN